MDVPETISFSFEEAYLSFLTSLEDFHKAAMESLERIITAIKEWIDWDFLSTWCQDLSNSNNTDLSSVQVTVLDQTDLSVSLHPSNTDCTLPNLKVNKVGVMP